MNRGFEIVKGKLKAKLGLIGSGERGDFTSSTMVEDWKKQRREGSRPERERDFSFLAKGDFFRSVLICREEETIRCGISAGANIRPNYMVPCHPRERPKCLFQASSTQKKKQKNNNNNMEGGLLLKSTNDKSFFGKKKTCHF